MRHMQVTKKMAVATTLAGVLIFSGYESALAQPHEMKNDPHQGRVERMVDDAEQKNVEKFLAATVKERKAFTQKRAEMRALMQAENPDVELAGKIAGELFDLREDLLKKAKDNGVTLPVVLQLLRGSGGMGGACGQGERSKFCRNWDDND